ncbi:hypothetical protein ACFL2Q_05085 [Thermodesulfobacteriota bacterium]
MGENVIVANVKPEGDKMILDLSAFWNSQFPDCLPLAHLLRDFHRDRWIRFHTLPDSKRYPETEEEVQTILRRHNMLIDELSGSGAELLLLTTSGSLEEEPVRNAQVAALDSSAVFWRTIQDHDVDEEWNWRLFASRWLWRKGILDPILKLVVEEEIRNVMLLSVPKRWIYHPYDGGADVILSTPTERDRLRDAHMDWLSNHPSGL